MTEQEAIEDLKHENEQCLSLCEAACESIKEYQCNCRDGIIERMIDELLQYREIGTVEECREAVGKQRLKKPIWKQDIGIVHKDYADGHGETVEEKWADWVCPDCGWFVGEQYIPRRHNQSKSNYCSRCGTKINWSESLEEMEDEQTTI